LSALCHVDYQGFESAGWGQNVNVDLQKGEVRFENTKGVASAQIEKAITDAGYEVVSA